MIFGSREFQSDAPENERLLLNKSILGLGTYRLFLELVEWDWGKMKKS